MTTVRSLPTPPPRPEVRILNSPQKKSCYTFVEDDNYSVYSNGPSEFSFVQNFSDQPRASMKHEHPLRESDSPYLSSQESFMKPQSAPIVDLYSEKWTADDYMHPVRSRSDDNRFPPPITRFPKIERGKTARKPSKKWLWIGLAVLALLVIAAAARGIASSEEEYYYRPRFKLLVIWFRRSRKRKRNYLGSFDVARPNRL